MLFKDGQVAATMVGARPKGKLVEWINSVLGADAAKVA
jgi:thioredoxin-like negative regulator of GroEL